MNCRHELASTAMNWPQVRTPEQRFADRTQITVAERDHFLAIVAAEQRRHEADNTIATNHGVRKITADTLRRQAITGALLGTGVITIRSRPVRLPYPKCKVG